MNHVVRSLSIAVLAVLFSRGIAAADDVLPLSTTQVPPETIASPSAEAAKVPEADPARTEVVFCVDCSGSMIGSFERAKQAMKYLVDEMQSRTPDAPIRVGVIAYGIGATPLEVSPLTDNVETINNYLSRLKINGGSEYVGLFIKNAVEGMKWSPAPNVTRRVIMVGNETAFQGPIDFRVAAQAAFARGFTVSAIYCPAPFDERQANMARATATTRVSVNGQRPMPNTFGRGMLGVENSWILTAYLGGGEAMKLSSDPRVPVLRYSPAEVGRLVEEVIPQQEAQMLQADAMFSALDQTGRLGRSGRPARASLVPNRPMKRY